MMYVQWSFLFLFCSFLSVRDNGQLLPFIQVFTGPVSAAATAAYVDVTHVVRLMLNVTQLRGNMYTTIFAEETILTPVEMCFKTLL